MQRASTPALLPLLIALAAPGCLDPDRGGNLVPATVTEDPSLPSSAFRDGVRFHLRTEGDPSHPTLVVLHGGPGRDMREVLNLAPLSDKYFVVFWDQRGTGLSERVPASEFSIDSYDHDLDDVVQQFSPNAPVTLVGHSWGAMYAALYIQRHPDRVAEAVLSEPGFLTGAIADQTKLFTFDLASPDLSAFGWSEGSMSGDSYAREDYLLMAAQGWSQPDWYLDPHDPADAMVFRLGATANRASTASAKQNGHWHLDFATGLDTFCKPVTLIGTTGDKVAGYDHQKTFHAPLFCAATLSLVRVDNADHAWIEKQPDVALGVMRAHLAAYGK